MTLDSQLYSKLRFYLAEAKKGYLYDFHRFPLLFLNAQNASFLTF